MDDSVFRSDWTAASLLRFTLPSIGMMVFMGLYTLADTLFAARLVNTDALSAINIVCPVVHLTVGLGTMLAAGGNAIVSRELGAGRQQAAREDFTLLILSGAAAGLLLFLLGALRLDPLLRALGASQRLLPYCRDYLSVLLPFLPAYILQTLFANLFVTAGRPGLGLALSLLSGGANLVLDALLMGPCRLGVRGAALGTGLGCLIPALAGLLFFRRNRGGALYFTRPLWRRSVLAESCFNGASELVGQLSEAVTTWLFNRVMLDLLGEDGVAAVTIAIYAQFLLNALFTGFSLGAAPVFGFLYGSGDRVRQRRVLHISLRFLALSSAAVFAVSLLGGPSIAGLFAERGSTVYRIAAEGFRIFSFSFLFCGLNLFTSALFTALSNGTLSAVLSFLRTFVLLSGNILLLPRLLGVTGVWLAVPAAECVMAGLSALCLRSLLRQLRD